MSESSRQYATIPVQPGTRDELRAAKVGGETYDDLVNRLLEDADARRLSDGGE